MQRFTTNLLYVATLLFAVAVLISCNATRKGSSSSKSATDSTAQFTNVSTATATADSTGSNNWQSNWQRETIVYERGHTDTLWRTDTLYKPYRITVIREQGSSSGMAQATVASSSNITDSTAATVAAKKTTATDSSSKFKLFIPGWMYLIAAAAVAWMVLKNINPKNAV